MDAVAGEVACARARGARPRAYASALASNTWPRTKRTTSSLLESVGWEAADMGAVEAARAIEPLCMLWCIPGFRSNEWNHAFKLLR